MRVIRLFGCFNAHVMLSIRWGSIGVLLDSLRIVMFFGWPYYLTFVFWCGPFRERCVRDNILWILSLMAWLVSSECWYAPNENLMVSIWWGPIESLVNSCRCWVCLMIEASLTFWVLNERICLWELCAYRIMVIYILSWFVSSELFNCFVKCVGEHLVEVRIQKRGEFFTIKK